MPQSKSIIPAVRNGMRPIHPGEILKEEFLIPYNLSTRVLAKAMGSTSATISRIVTGKQCITLDTAMRLAKVLQTTPEFWLNLQNAYDIKKCHDYPLTDIIPLKLN